MKNNPLTYIIQLIKSAPLPMSFAGLGLIFTLLVSWEVTNEKAQGGYIVYLISCTSMCIGVGISCCSLADAMSRLREYQRIKYLFLRYGFRTRIFSQLIQSRCQRDAVLLAAREAGFNQKTKAFYRAQGYRWYHILPDMIVINPVLLLHPKFLKATFWPSKKKKSQASFG